MEPEELGSNDNSDIEKNQPLIQKADLSTAPAKKSKCKRIVIGVGIAATLMLVTAGVLVLCIHHPR